MKVKELMTPNVIRIRPEEPVAVAARNLTHYNIGMLPVCGSDGKLRGVITDRDIVTRCLAAGRSPEATTVGQIMTSQVHSVEPNTEASLAAAMMGKRHQGVAVLFGDRGFFLWIMGCGGRGGCACAALGHYEKLGSAIYPDRKGTDPPQIASYSLP